MPTTTTLNADIFYETIGQGEALVLIPGLGAHSTIWGPFPKRFAGARRVIAYDPRGLGRSSAGNQPLTLELMAADVAAVLDAAGAPTAAVLGASLGSQVALRYALDYPDRLTKLVLATPAPFDTRYGRWVLDTLRLLADRLAPQEFIDALMPLSFAPPFFEKNYGMIKEVSRMLAPTPAGIEQIKRQLQALRNAEIPKDLSTLNVPVLIIAGHRDVLAPIEEARRLAAKLRRSRLIAFPGAGHSIFVESPDEVVKEIRDFLEMEAPSSR